MVRVLPAFCAFRERRLPNVSAGLTEPLTVLDGRLMVCGETVPDNGGCGLARRLLKFAAKEVLFVAAVLVGLAGACQSSPSKSSIADLVLDRGPVCYRYSMVGCFAKMAANEVRIPYGTLP